MRVRRVQMLIGIVRRDSLFIAVVVLHDDFVVCRLSLSFPSSFGFTFANRCFFHVFRTCTYVQFSRRTVVCTIVVLTCTYVHFVTGRGVFRCGVFSEDGCAKYYCFRMCLYDDSYE